MNCRWNFANWDHRIARLMPPAPHAGWNCRAKASTGAQTANGGNIEVTWGKLETLKVPILLLTGDADLYTPPSVLRMFTARMPNAESAVIPETGHSSYWEDPQAFNQAVLAFIRKH